MLRKENILLQLSKTTAVGFRITESEWLRLEWASRGHLVQIPCSCRATQSQLVAQDCVQMALNIFKDGDSTTSLNNLCQHLSHPHTSWCSEGTFCVSACTCCLWPCLWAPLLQDKHGTLSLPFFLRKCTSLQVLGSSLCHQTQSIHCKTV